MNIEDKIKEMKKYDFLYSNPNTPAVVGKYGDGNHRVEYLKNMDTFSKLFIDTVRYSKKILDVGCGTGGVLKYIKQFNETGNFVGVDISKEAVKISNNICIMEMDCTEMDFDNNKFDVVFCFDVMEHIPSEYLFKALAEQVRVSSRYIFHRTCLNNYSGQDKILTENGFEPAHISGKPYRWWKNFLNINKNILSYNIIYLEKSKDYINVVLEKHGN